MPESDGRWTSLLQEDDGLTDAHLSGGRYRTTFVLERTGETVTLSAAVAGDGYPEFARERFVLVLHGAAPGSVDVAGSAHPVLAGRVELANAGTGLEVTFPA